MSIVEILVFVLVLALVFYLVESVFKISPEAKKIIRVILVIIVILYLLSILGVVPVVWRRG